MDVNSFFKKYGIHFIAIALFVIVGMIYFSPQVGGEYGIKQHDIKEFKSASNEIAHFRETDNAESLWTNSIFGGMPATQISVQHKGNFFKSITTGFLNMFPLPLGAFLLHLICFYIFAMFLRIKPAIAILGAFAFAFASYEIIILQAGHNTKSIAVAFLPAVLGAFIYAYKRNWKIGAALSALFMAFEMGANHLQVTYYMGFLLIGLGIYYFVEALRAKKFKNFMFATGGIMAGYLIAMLINYGNISMTNDYAQYTTRGGNDVTITVDGKDAKANSSSGLDKDYITQWSYGKQESFTFISPYALGSHSSAALGNTQFADVATDAELFGDELKGALGMPLYWGEQPIVAGPFYLGVVVVFLSLLALVFVKDRKIWVFAGVSVLALLLSWGKNFMGLTEFFIDNVPGYNMFRTVTIILVIVELCIPVLAVLLLQRLYEEREAIKEKKMHFLIASGGFFLFLLIFKFSVSGPFSSENDLMRIDRQKAAYTNQLKSMDPGEVAQNYGVNVNDPVQLDQFIEAQLEPAYAGLEGIKKVRKEVFHKSANRSIVIALFAIGICALFFFTSIPSIAIVAGLFVLLLIDLVPVNQNYLGTYEDANGKPGDLLHWSLLPEKEYPVAAEPADHEIMRLELEGNKKLQSLVAKAETRGKAKADELEYAGKDKRRVIDSYKFNALGRGTNYRVFDRNGGWSSSRAGYFHKSLGGYHGAKLRNIQNAFDFHIAFGNPEVLNMLNVKYVISGANLSPTRSELGAAWAVKSIKSFETPNDEIRGLGKKLSVKNIGPGSLVVNDKNENSAEVFIGENVMYFNGDSSTINLSYNIRSGMKLYFVSDAKGKTNLMMDFSIDNDTTGSFTKLAEITVVDEFNPKDEAVMLSSEVKKLSTQSFSGEAQVAMKSYAPNKIEYDANCRGKQLVVFSEIYYPDGWKAVVDGKEQEILKVDYLLRGLELSDGKHKVEFIYDNAKYHSAGTMATIGSILLLLLMGVLGFMEYKNSKKSKEAA